MNFIMITDTATGKELRVIQPTLEPKFLVIISDLPEPAVVPARSIGKVIRTWMKEREKDIG